MTIRSLAIGQGELGVTPLQMANVAAVIANRGYYYPPHLIKEIENDTIQGSFKEKKYSKYLHETFEPIIEGMEQVVNGNLCATGGCAGITNVRKNRYGGK